MKRFDAIEGLRGWLAWTVVLDHLASTTALDAGSLGRQMVIAGRYAVLIFIIISGFVITHLIVAKPEPYGSYLTRRFMRIFPLFSVTCVIGFFTTDLYADLIAQLPWASEPRFAQARIAEYAAISASAHTHFWANFLAHVTMMHGAISSNVLPYSQLVFNGPAWSISLEWQFYLLAPFILVLVQRGFVLLLAVLFVVLEVAYLLGAFGQFDTPSFLPGAAGYFALGIGSRLAYPQIAGTVSNPMAVAAVAMLLLPFGWPAVPILVWLVVMTGICANSVGLFTRCYHQLLEGRAATFFGSRSYSVYLAHFPVLIICLWLWHTAYPEATKWPTFIGLTAMVLPGTLIVAEILYRTIERPGISLGSRLAAKLLKRSAEPSRRVTAPT